MLNDNDRVKKKGLKFMNTRSLNIEGYMIEKDAVRNGVTRNTVRKAMKDLFTTVFDNKEPIAIILTEDYKHICKYMDKSPEQMVREFLIKKSKDGTVRGGLDEIMKKDADIKSDRDLFMQAGFEFGQELYNKELELYRHAPAVIAEKEDEQEREDR